MDGRWVTAIAFLVVPAILIGITVWKFGSNPVPIFALLAAMVAGGFYLLSYTSAFAAGDSSS